MTKVHAPLAVHLLACMLARAFKPEEAISIWYELVRGRKQEIESKIELEPQPISACMAARQDITREQLALWDASARSWLRTADEAKKVQRTQLQLVLNNLHLNFSHHDTTYESVIEIWTHAMVGLEKCINGTPQTISDGSILLAISTWHLYVDLIVAHEVTTKIPFNDPLLLQGGAMTIGLEFAPGSRSQVYGDPVKVASSTEVQRISMDQLLVMVFGDLLRSWGVPRDEEWHRFCANWLVNLGNVITARWFRLASYSETEWLSWIDLLVLAASKYLELRKSDVQTCSMLLNWGRRRCRTFLGSAKSTPFFGLDNALLVSALTLPNALEAGIHFLRQLADEMGLKPYEAVIKHTTKLSRSRRIELITAIPHAKSNNKRAIDGSHRSQDVHCRWLGIVVDRSQEVGHDRCQCERCDMSCPCVKGYGLCKHACHISDETDCHRAGPWPSYRANSVSSMVGEECRILVPQQVIHEQYLGLSDASNNNNSSRAIALLGHGFEWIHPAGVFHNHKLPTSAPDPCPSFNDPPGTCKCLETCYEETEYYHNAFFRPIYGSMESLGLFVRIQPEAGDADMKQRLQMNLAENVLSRIDKLDEPEDLQFKFSESGSLFADLLKHKARTPSLDTHLVRDTYTFELFADLLRIRTLPSIYLKSLTYLSLASKLYENLEGATIPTDILDVEIHRSKWLSHVWERSASSGRILGSSIEPPDSEILLRYPMVAELDRAGAFACIAMFESGLHNLSPEYCEPVIALASANSLFVAQKLLSDPTESVQGPVRLVLGNIGRAGISMLVLPQQLPRIRPLGKDWRLAQHETYDGNREDNFSSTTLVLSFTDWKRPLPGVERGTIDVGVNFIECVVSVHDRGMWVADLDPMNLRLCNCGKTNDEPSSCGHLSDLAGNVTSIDSWEELLDAPDNVAIMRANGKWVARLAAIAIRKQQGHQQRTCILSANCAPCVECFVSNHSDKYDSENVGIIID